MALSLVHPALGVAVYSGVAAVWLIPDRRVERFLSLVGETPGPSGGPGPHSAEPGS